jgi:hypothetical protein
MTSSTIAYSLDLGEPPEYVSKRQSERSLADLVGEAWQLHEAASSEPWLVRPSAPVLFFGDHDAFMASSLRVITVALNPSRLEFPSTDPLARFPRADERDRYVAALSGYFQDNPYASWFAFYEEALQGMGVSYYGGSNGTALHTDVGSPLATDPTWSKLDSNVTVRLESTGRPLWHRLVNYLQPDVVLWSTARRWLDFIELDPLSEWRPVAVFDRKKDGTDRKTPVRILTRRYALGSGKEALFAFGPAQVKPLGDITHEQKREAGAAIREAHLDAG